MDSAIRRWSTDDVQARQRVAYWIDAVAEAVFSVAVSPRARQEFHGALISAPLDGLVVTRAEGSARDSFRTRRLLASADTHSFNLVADFDRPWVAFRRGHQTSMLPGDLMLIDSQELNGGRLPDHGRLTTITLPPRWLLTWIGEPLNLLGRRIDHRVGWGSVLSAFVGHLSPEVAVSHDVPARIVTDQLGSLMALVEDGLRKRARRGQAARSGNQRGVQRILDMIRQRLDEPLLNAGMVADALGVPDATLHAWLRNSDDTFGGLLQRARMAAASDMLFSRASDALSVMEIGRRVGIPNPSHFGKLARRHFGESPLAHRRSSISEADPPSAFD